MASEPSVFRSAELAPESKVLPDASPSMSKALLVIMSEKSVSRKIDKLKWC